MRILPPSQIFNFAILEQVLEELRLNIVESIYSISDKKDLFSLDQLDLKNKLALLGLMNIEIGKFISLDLSSEEFTFISPQFYRSYRKVNQHRGNRMSMDYIFHSAGMMNTLLHSNTEFYNSSSIFGDDPSFFDFNTYRDNQYPELNIGDGYIIVPYSSNRLQTLKTYLAKNPIIFRFLPAGYTFIFLSDYRNGYHNGVLQFDNFLSYKDKNDSIFYLYWENFSTYESLEKIVLDSGEIEVNHILKFYDPYTFRDNGLALFENLYSRPSSEIHIPLVFGSEHYLNVDEYLEVVNAEVLVRALLLSKEGYEQDLNNPLLFKDIFQGDFLFPNLRGERLSEHPSHVNGLKSIHNPTYSYSSLFSRGESLATQYDKRELLQEPEYDDTKSGIISDSNQLDSFSFIYNDEYQLYIIWYSNRNYVTFRLYEALGLNPSLSSLILSNTPSLVRDSLTLEEGLGNYNSLIENQEYPFIVELRQGSTVIESNKEVAQVQMNLVAPETFSIDFELEDFTE